MMTAHEINNDATLGSDNVWRWNKSGNIVPADCLEEAGISFDRDARSAAVSVELDALRVQMVEAEQNMSDEARAERDFEMRAAFGPGETVVNVFTGQKFTT